jgi:hypothetical protein
LVDLVRKQIKEDDAHERYMKCLADWQSAKQLFDLLPYDPFYKRQSKAKQQLFWEVFRFRLGRVFRIQVKLVVLDGLNRSRLHNVHQDEMLERIGNHIQQLLDPSDDEERSDVTQKLINEDLPQVRRLKLSTMWQTQSSGTIEESTNNENDEPMRDELFTDDESVLVGEELSMALAAFEIQEMNVPKFFSTNHTSVLFFQLLEFVIIQALRLERYCVQTDAQWNKARQQ